jgi:DNA-binding transcriptional ArsR family regulator
MHVFSLLGDPVRLRIAELLATGEKPVWRLVEILGPEFRIGQPAVSHHLRVLRDAGFVDFRRIGKSNRYRLNWNAMTTLDAAVEALFVAWENRTGWPYDDFRPALPLRLHRLGRAGLRGRSERQIESRAEEDDWWFLPD